MFTWHSTLVRAYFKSRLTTDYITVTYAFIDMYKMFYAVVYANPISVSACTFSLVIYYFLILKV